MDNVQKEFSLKELKKELYTALSVYDAENIIIVEATKIKTSDGVEWTVTCQHECREEWHVFARTGDTKLVTLMISGNLPE